MSSIPFIHMAPAAAAFFQNSSLFFLSCSSFNLFLGASSAFLLASSAFFIFSLLSSSLQHLIQQFSLLIFFFKSLANFNAYLVSSNSLSSSLSSGTLVSSFCFTSFLTSVTDFPLISIGHLDAQIKMPKQIGISQNTSSAHQIHICLITLSVLVK